MPATPPPATTKSNVPRSSGSAGRPSRVLRSRKTVSSESSGATSCSVKRMASQRASNPARSCSATWWTPSVR